MLLLASVLLAERAVHLWWHPVIGSLRACAARGAAAIGPAGRTLAARTRPLAAAVPPVLGTLAQQAALSAICAHLPIRIPVNTALWLTDAAKLLQATTLVKQSQRGVNLLALGAEYGIRSAGHELGFKKQALTGAAVLVGTRLLCTEVAMPYTGRTALLPYRWVEVGFNQTLGRLVKVIYPIMALATSAAEPLQFFALAAKCPEQLWLLQPLFVGVGIYTGFKVLQQLPRELEGVGQHTALVQGAYGPLHRAALASAAAAGRPLAPAWADAHVMPATFVNAVSVPGGGVYVHTRLITQLPQDKREAGVTFVVAHEVAHALCRHAMGNVVTKLLHTYGITLVAGMTGLAASAWRQLLVEQAKAQDADFRRSLIWLLRPFAGRTRERQVAGETRRLPDEASVGAQLAMHIASCLMTLRDSRRDEHEADMVALCLARDAGMSVETTLGGARATFSMFARMPGGLHLPKLLCSHPPPEERLAAVQAAVGALPAR